MDQRDLSFIDQVPRSNEPSSILKATGVHLVPNTEVTAQNRQLTLETRQLNTINNRPLLDGPDLSVQQSRSLRHGTPNCPPMQVVSLK